MKWKNILIFFITIILIVAIYFVYNKITSNEILSLNPRNGDSSISAEFLNAQKAVEFFRSEIEKNPDVIKNYVELAQLFLQEARITGNHHEYIKKASLLIEEALKKEPENFDVMVTKASLLMTFHKFSEAKDLINRAIKINSFNAAAFGILCDANIELGLYEEAVKASDRMLGIRPDLRSYSRASYLREIHGDINGAIEAMTLAANSGVTGQENRSWVLYNLGNLFLQTSKVDTAEFIYNGILEERSNYANALNGLADIYTAKKDYFKAIEYLVKASQISPEHIYIEKLADIYKVLGQNGTENEMVGKVLEAFDQHKSDGYNVDLEYARFCLNHNKNLNEALESAKSEMNTRPSNIDVLEVFAWALYKNGKSEEAVPYIQKALRLNTKRISLYYHAGMIFKDANMYTEAVKYFEKVFEYNAYINPIYLEEAKEVHKLLADISAIK